MLILGLTGGIATGKSTVAGVFERLGAYRIDTDRLAREAVEPGQPAWEAIVRYFGRDILDPSGHIDRKKLGGIVFAEPQKRTVLEKLTHPAVRALVFEYLACARKQNICVALVEVPLLFEAGFDRDVNKAVVVTTDEESQLKRLMQRDGLSEEDARRRIAAQMPLSEKVSRADYVIDNSGLPAETEKQVREIWQVLTREC